MRSSPPHSEESVGVPVAVAQPKGTHIDVKDVFYNVPARRKFLRADAVEFQYIDQTIKRLALSDFSVELTVFHHDKKTAHIRPATQNLDAKKDRVQSVVGADFLDKAVYVETSFPLLHIWGWVCPALPETRQNTVQYLYINGRWVRSPGVHHALKAACKEMTHSQSRIGYVLFFEMDPTWVDVNVHPAKEEVRFADKKQLYQWLYQAVHAAFAAPAASLPVTDAPAPAAVCVDVQHDASHQETVVPSQINMPVALQPVSAGNAAISACQQPSLHAENTSPVPSEVASPPCVVPTWVSDVPIETDSVPACYVQEGESTSTDTALPPQTPLPEGTTPQLGCALAQLHGIYILAQNAQGLVLVDIHAAHERIRYEESKQHFLANTVPVQTLLLPVAVPLSPALQDVMVEYTTFFHQIGFQFRLKEGEGVAVKTCPLSFEKTAIPIWINRVLTDLVEHGYSRALEARALHHLAERACKRALRAGDTLSMAQMNALLRKIETTPRSAYCNHGRPTYTQVSMKKLDSWFLRGQ